MPAEAIDWEAIGVVTGIIALLGAILNTFITRFAPFIRARANARSLAKRWGAEEYPVRTIEDALRYYVEPLCSQVDPTGREDFRSVLAFSAPLFTILDKALEPQSGPQYLILLADSGMGKTSALINYYQRSLRKWGRRNRIKLLYLGSPGVVDRISKLESKAETVLFLDALDEDVAAIRDSNMRVQELLDVAQAFRAVVISCRSQFFARDEEITQKTGILKVGPRAAGDSGMYELQKIYLIPFTKKQIRLFLRKRYGYLRRKARRRALAVVERVGDVSARPMLLAYIDDLLKQGETFSRVSDAYSRIISAWLAREEAHVGNVDALREFSARLAVDLYLHRDERGGEHAPADEIEKLAKAWKINLERWKLTGRSLLNRDGQGNFKFAHRSIMEFLFVQQFLHGEIECLGTVWTDQMQVFLRELAFERNWNHAFANFVREASISENESLRVSSQALLLDLIDWYIGRSWRLVAYDYPSGVDEIRTTDGYRLRNIEKVLFYIDLLLFGSLSESREIEGAVIYHVPNSYVVLHRGILRTKEGAASYDQEVFRVKVNEVELLGAVEVRSMDKRVIVQVRDGVREFPAHKRDNHVVLEFAFTVAPDTISLQVICGKMAAQTIRKQFEHLYRVARRHSLSG